MVAQIDVSRKENVKPYIVFSDSVLIEIANTKPKTLEELGSINGIGNKKIDKYGSDVLSIVKNSRSDK